MTGAIGGPQRPVPDRVLDVRGLSCPMPLLRAKVVLGEMASGEHLRVDTTDPHSVTGFETLCARTGHRLLHHEHAGGVHTFLLRRG